MPGGLLCEQIDITDDIEAKTLLTAQQRYAQTLASDLDEPTLLRAILDSESELRRAQEIADVGSWAIDLTSNAPSWSEEPYRILGVPVGTAVDLEAFLGHVHADDRPRVVAAWDAAKLGAPYHILHRVVRGDDVQWVEERAEVFLTPDGSVVGCEHRRSPFEIRPEKSWVCSACTKTSPTAMRRRISSAFASPIYVR